MFFEDQVHLIFCYTARYLKEQQLALQPLQGVGFQRHKLI